MTNIEPKPLPDLDAPLVPAKSAAGFTLGMAFSDVLTMIALTQEVRFMKIPNIQEGYWELMESSTGWIGEIRLRHFQHKNQVYRSLAFKNLEIILDFAVSDLLYKITVGPGYRSKFGGIGIGDDVAGIGDGYTIEFNSIEDDFIIHKDGEWVPGLHFVTDCKQPLDLCPKQIVESISIHDVSLADVTGK
ncbi:hypothetical protein GAO09_28860 [Rhizobiales bacterium RZME27]|uniref:Uncharacterized protein n=1 Tax=Endobacterium cereale TaxID=2663029 RepID=A0A6A8AFE4_9HYPH|nr:hypothetical protein [Endobacterium cereale]MEB2845783.1 hypothetical protein [Endobacterium cereale]MQY50045.1 hypothetical protein [Endobacterium cereale]